MPNNPSKIDCEFKNRTKLVLGISESGTYYLVDQATLDKVNLYDFIDTCCPDGSGDCFKLSVNYSTKKSSSADMCLDYSFSSTETYDLVSELNLSDIGMPVITSTTVISQDTTEPKELPDVPDLITSIVATAALGLAILQQAKANKDKLESSKCCSDTKVKLSELSSKVSEIETKLASSAEESKKAIHAEMYETYQELKQIKEDSDSLKEILLKVVDRLKI